MICRELNCSQPLDLEPDSDVSGLGVIIGFVAPASLALLIVILYYLFALRPELDPFRDEDGRSSPERKVPFRPNPVDEYMLRWVARASQGRLIRREVTDKMEKKLIQVTKARCGRFEALLLITSSALLP